MRIIRSIGLGVQSLTHDTVQKRVTDFKDSFTSKAIFWDSKRNHGLKNWQCMKAIWLLSVQARVESCKAEVGEPPQVGDEREHSAHTFRLPAFRVAINCSPIDTLVILNVSQYAQPLQRSWVARVWL